MNLHKVESLIVDFIQNQAGHFIVITNDRLYVNLLRKTLVSQLELPNDCITIVSSEKLIMKTVKEMSIRKKKLVVFIESLLDHKRMDDHVRRINRRINNAKLIIMTTESQLPRLALLREEGLAENWIVKPVVINLMLVKIAQVIMPPGNLEKLIQTAEGCVERKAYRFALQACRRIFEIKPDSAVAYMIMGEAYKGLDKANDMVEAYEQASELGEYYFEPLQKLVEYYDQQKDPDKKLATLERLDMESPLNIQRKLDIGGLHLDMGEGDDARDIFEDALNMSQKEEVGDVSQFAAQIGDIYAARNRKEAEEYYRRALEYKGRLDSSDIAIFNNLGLELRRQGRYQDAINAYKRALQVEPRSETIYYNLALAYMDTKQLKNAIKCADYSIQLNDGFYRQDPVICYNLAFILSKSGKNEKSIELLKTALDLNPAYESAKALLKSLSAKE